MLAASRTAYDGEVDECDCICEAKPCQGEARHLYKGKRDVACIFSSTRRKEQLRGDLAEISRAAQTTATKEYLRASSQ